MMLKLIREIVRRGLIINLILKNLVAQIRRRVIRPHQRTIIIPHLICADD